MIQGLRNGYGCDQPRWRGRAPWQRPGRTGGHCVSLGTGKKWGARVCTYVRGGRGTVGSRGDQLAEPGMCAKDVHQC